MGIEVNHILVQRTKHNENPILQSRLGVLESNGNGE